MISASKNKLTLFVLFRALILITVVPLLPILTARDFAWTEAWIYSDRWIYCKTLVCL
jgi:hypothetical protein